MGYLDDESISGTTRIDLGRGYWVDVRNCLSREQSEVAEKLLMSATIYRDAEGGARSNDTSAYRTYRVAASIVAWNLDDGEGDQAVIWPYNNHAAILAGVRRLPDPAFIKIWQHIDKLNTPRSQEEQARFPDASDAGDQERDPGAGDAHQAGVGALALAGTRGEPAGLPTSAVA
jgi:hypothetical protein